MPAMTLHHLFNILCANPIVTCCLQDMMVLLQGRPAIAFDVLSVDVGITPSKAIPGSSTIATPVKPISGYADPTPS